MKKIIILDNSIGEIHVFSYDENIWEDAEHFLSENYNNEEEIFRESQCSWLITEKEDEPISITIH